MGIVSIFPDVIEGTSKINGRGAFAGKHFNSGDVVFDWTPTLLVHRDELPIDECIALQVGPDLYIPAWHERCVDDLTNHSCDPSAAVVIGNGKVLLKAIRPIKPMMEITFDYSLTMLNDAFAMVCNCGAKNCRGIVKEYKTLPAAIRQRYEWMKIVPDYVIPANGRAG